MQKAIKTPKRVLSSIVYIQAAVFQATGIRVRADELMMVLLSEGLITRGMIRSLEVPDLNRYGQSYTPTEKIYQDIAAIPIDVVVTKYPELAVEEIKIEPTS